MTSDPPTPVPLPPSALRVLPAALAGAAPNRVVKRQVLSVDDYVAGVRAGDRMILGRTFSLMESNAPTQQALATQVVNRLLPYSGGSVRLGVTGVPGVGKSTFIDSLGVHLIDQGHRVAVLSIDPSSEISGGSILGDKTRMERLSVDPKAMVRPSACGKWKGGVAKGTRESILVCEAAGFDVVIVETVGVGQSETQVASMVDFFLLLMLAGAGDELQGIKRGIMELADAIAINKADGDNLIPAQAARSMYEMALHLLRPATEGWTPRVLTCSALQDSGMAEIWNTVKDHRELLQECDRLEEKRAQQNMFWLRYTAEQILIERFYGDAAVREHLDAVRNQVAIGHLSPFGAAEQLVERFAAHPAPTPKGFHSKDNQK